MNDSKWIRIMGKYSIKKRKLAYLIMLMLIISCAYPSCYYDKESLVYPNGGDCDTTNISLSTDLNGIMEAHCYNCHSSSNAPTFGGGYNLQDYTTIRNAATSGVLLSSLNQDGILGQPMPQGGAKLSDCNISKFSAWINNGAPNN